MKSSAEYDTVLYAEGTVRIPPLKAKKWFLALGRHPERYRFETHEGFFFTEGTFGEVGARFYTREAFCGLRVRLRFELTAVDETSFVFRQYAPIPGVWGRFSIHETEKGNTRIKLAIGGENRLTRTLLRLPGLHNAVKHQIHGEIAHVIDSMAEMYLQDNQQER